MVVIQLSVKNPWDGPERACWGVVNDAVLFVGVITTGDGIGEGIIYVGTVEVGTFLACDVNATFIGRRLDAILNVFLTKGRKNF